VELFVIQMHIGSRLDPEGKSDEGELPTGPPVMKCRCEGSEIRTAWFMGKVREGQDGSSEGEQWIGGQQRIGIQSGDSEASSLSAGLQQRTTGKHFGARIFPQGAPLYRLANGEEARGWKHGVRRTHHNGGGREFGNECRDAARQHGAGVAGIGCTPEGYSRYCLEGKRGWRSQSGGEGGQGNGTDWEGVGRGTGGGNGNGT
jgi:hypothetical protein